MKEINVSATPKKRICREQGQINFSTVKLQHKNNDRKIVPKRMGQVKKSGHLTSSVPHSVHDTGRSPH